MWDLGSHYNSKIWFNIFKMSLDDSFVLNSGHSCRGTWGISFGSYFHPSAEERCWNSSFNPQLGPAGGSSTLRRPIVSLQSETGLWWTCSWQWPRLWAFRFYTAHTNTSARCIFSGLHFLCMSTPNAAQCFGVFLKPTRCAEIKERQEGRAGTSCFTGSLKKGIV